MKRQKHKRSDFSSPRPAHPRPNTVNVDLRCGCSYIIQPTGRLNCVLIHIQSLHGVFVSCSAGPSDITAGGKKRAPALRPLNNMNNHQRDTALTLLCEAREKVGWWRKEIKVGQNNRRTLRSFQPVCYTTSRGKSMFLPTIYVYYDLVSINIRLLKTFLDFKIALSLLSVQNEFPSSRYDLQISKIPIRLL